MQGLDISHCRGMEEEGMRAIAALTQITRLGSEGLSWFVEPSYLHSETRPDIQKSLHL